MVCGSTDRWGLVCVPCVLPELNPLMVTFKASVQQHFPFEELKDTPIPNGLELVCVVFAMSLPH